MRVSLVVAVAENGVIGRSGALPWHVSSDLKRFRRITMGHPIVMGRKTFASLAKPLDGRDNIVVTRNKDLQIEGVHFVHSVPDALILARTLTAQQREAEVMVIGGAEIFRVTLPIADCIYLTEIRGAPEGDVYFDPLDPEEWREVLSEPMQRGTRDDFDATFRILERRGASQQERRDS